MGKKRGEGPYLESAQEAERRQLLTEALAFVLPEKDVEKACGGLLQAFGSFDGIFAAPEEVLREIPGMGPEAARFLRLVIRLSQAYLEERSWNLQRIYDTASAVEMFRPKFLGRKTEAACLMLLDGRGRMVYNDLVCEGSVTYVPLHLRRILRLCIQYNVDDVFLAHNHPSGVAFPSRDDLLVTDRLLTALEGIGARLCDHIILADDSYYSFAASGALERQTDLMLDAHAREYEAVRQLARRLTGED